MFWQFNISVGVQGLSELQILDGYGPQKTLAVTLQTFDPKFTGTDSFNGSFGAADINPAVAGSIDELAGHFCMVRTK